MTTSEIKTWIEVDYLLHRQWMSAMMPLDDYIIEYKSSLEKYIDREKQKIACNVHGSQVLCFH